MKPNRSLIAGLFAVALLTLALTTGNNTVAQNAAPVPAELFRDKIVTVYQGDPLKGNGKILKDAKLEKLGDRWFLIGTGVTTGQAGEWDGGLVSGIAWDDVTSFYIFTQAQFDEKMKDTRA